MASLSFFTLKHVLLACLTVYSVQCISVQDSQVKAGADTFDWRTKGVISPVSNQGQQGSSYPIVIGEGVESLHAIQAGIHVILLSRQEVADCCDDKSGLPKDSGYDCIINIGGLCTEPTYHSNDRTCRNGTCQSVGKVSKSGYIPTGREDLMVAAIHQTPLSAYLDASQASFEEYVSGIYSDPSCSSTNLDHILQIVGYGTDAGQDYWILKNSWGSQWGENGYMRILRGKNMCGIASKTFYPINE